jgi:hypothetical protein
MTGHLERTGKKKVADCCGEEHSGGNVVQQI